MAIVAVRMALFAINTAPTTGGRVTLASRTPARTTRNPANLRLAHRAQQAVASRYLCNQRLLCTKTNI